MLNHLRASSPQALARFTGAFFLLMVLLGMCSQIFVADRLLIDGDASATTANILAHRGLFQLGFALYMTELACYITMTVLFYELLKPVSRTVSLLAASFGLVGCVVKIVSRLFYLIPLFVLNGVHSLNGFDSSQVSSLVSVLLKVNAQGAGIAMVFFGVFAMLKGFLIFQSTFFPRWLGVIGMVAGVFWLTFLYAPLAYRILSFTIVLGLTGSATQIFWLLVFGVDVPQWNQKAIHAAQQPA